MQTCKQSHLLFQSKKTAANKVPVVVFQEHFLSGALLVRSNSCPLTRSKPIALCKLQQLHSSFAQCDSCIHAGLQGGSLCLWLSAGSSGSVLSAVAMGALLLALWYLNYLRTTHQVRLLWLIMVQVSQTTSLRSHTTSTAT